MKKNKIILVGGARPNFIKIAALYVALKQQLRRCEPLILHTGQHYDYQMSQVFFEELGLPEPKVYLSVGSASHAVQTAAVMTRFESVCLRLKPDLVVVVGDVNSTLACTLVASKLLIPVAHVEAGLRSLDRTMPEEINRLVTDLLSTYLFAPSREAVQNLLREGVPKANVFFVGNVMIDTLQAFLERAKSRNSLGRFGVTKRRYALLTLHRPSNVDDRETFSRLALVLNEISQRIPLIFPVHPRTRATLNRFRLQALLKNQNMKLLEPVSYLESLELICNARFVLTDSGGIQEETTFLDVPCLTLRNNTERPLTITQGTNTLIGQDYDKLLKTVACILSGCYKHAKALEYWDGKAARRIVQVLVDRLE